MVAIPLKAASPRCPGESRAGGSEQQFEETDRIRVPVRLS